MINPTCLKLIKIALIFSLFSIFSSSISLAENSNNNEYLDMDITQLMQMKITSVAKKTQNLSDAAAAIYVVSGDDIHRSGVTSIPEALRMVPGLQVARIDANKWAITSRGFNGNFANKLLVMIDGRTVYSPSFAGTYWDAQGTMLDDIDRIEVIRGPGATVWGANAVNGVINIITKKVQDTQGGLVSAGTGNHEQFVGGTRYGAKFGESVYGRAYVTYHAQDSFVLYETEQDASDDWDSLRGGFRLDGEYGDKNSWTVQGDIYSNNENQILYPVWSSTMPYISQVDDDFKSSGWNILSRWQKKISATDSWTIQTYYDYTERDEAILKQTHKTFDFDLQHACLLGERNSMVMGLGYRSITSDYENTFSFTINPAHGSYDLFSAFIQDEITLISDQLWFTLGTKWEHNDFTGHEIQPNGRLLWKMTDKQRIWAAVSRAVRTPAQFEIGGNLVVGVDPTSPPFPRVVSMSANSDYDAEELIAYELGYRWLPMANLSFDLTLFYNDYEQLQSPGAATSPTISIENIMQGSTHGVEFLANLKPFDWLEFQMGYTYLKIDLDIDATSAKPNLDDITSEISPQHQASLRTTVDINENIQFNLLMRYVGELQSSKNITSRKDIQVDEYIALDATISWKPKKNIELMLVGQNLLDDAHLEYASEFATLSTEIERSVYGKFTYQF